MSDEDFLEYHYINVIPSVDMLITVMVNGFPAIREAVTAGSSWKAMVDIHNVGVGNTLSVQGITNAGTEGTLEFFLRSYLSTMIVTREDGIDIPLRHDDETPGADDGGFVYIPINEDGVAAAEYEYDLPNRPIFREVYLGDEKIDEELARRGAKSLLDAFDSGKRDKLMMALWARNEDYAIIHGITVEEVEAQAADALDRAIAKRRPRALIQAGTPVDVTMWCDNRLAELTIGGEPMLTTRTDSDGNSISFPTFIGMREGRVGVLR